jgi:hemolysin activation/secretion protein
MKARWLSWRGLAVLASAIGCLGLGIAWLVFFAHPPPPRTAAPPPAGTNSASREPPSRQGATETIPSEQSAILNPQSTMESHGSTESRPAVESNPQPSQGAEETRPAEQSAIRNPQSAMESHGSTESRPVVESNPPPSQSATEARPAGQSAILNPQSAIPPSAAAPPAGTNAAANAAAKHYVVERYEVTGNTLLPEEALRAILDRHTGTNLAPEDIISAIKDLKAEYHARGYDTIDVTFPQQVIVSNTFKIQVFEGLLVDITVKGNRYYSSNNVRRALPSLKTNTFLNSKVFQPELDRANANQDRQIFPKILPGPETNTSALELDVKDRFPLHVKIEANNQSSPGTPEMRLNSSAVYNNLWQLNHSLGAQYSFSEEVYKGGDQWDFYDRPLVANASAFYRMPLSAPESVSEAVAGHPGNFGYNEATKRFELPPPTGTMELNVYASHSTIDTGVTPGPLTLITNSPTISFSRGSFSQDITINDAVGFRLSKPLPDFYGVRSHVQAGLDYKSYHISSFSTNDFFGTEHLVSSNGTPFTTNFTTPSPVPPSIRSVEYLPVTVRWDADLPDPHGSTSFGLNYSANLLYSNGKSNLQAIAGSPRAGGYWQIAGANVAREQAIQGEWKLALRADGQWASEPLISNEQFGVGGVNGVRGFREGEVFGDAGWRITSELKTPPHRIGYVGGGTGYPLSVRASAFFDYADTYLLDAQSRPPHTPLCGTGLGGAFTLGPNFEGRLLFAWPILNTPNSESGQLRVAFALSAQF